MICIPKENLAKGLFACKKLLPNHDAYLSMTSLKSPSKRLSLKKMDAERDHMRFYTFMRLKLGDSAIKILQDLHTVFGPTCGNRSIVFRWVEAFQREQGPSSAGKGPGRPFSVRNEQNIALVKSLIDEDPHSTIRELSEACDPSVGTIHSILHEDLHMRNLAARWVPRLLTEEQKNGELTVRASCSVTLSLMVPSACVTWPQGSKLRSTSMASLTNAATRRG